MKGPLILSYFHREGKKKNNKIVTKIKQPQQNFQAWAFVTRLPVASL